MTDSSSRPELQQNSTDDVLEVNKDLERMIEDTENISVQLTWMAYDMVALRTSPKLMASMWTLEEAYQRCRAVICGDREQQPEMDRCSHPTATTLSQIFQMENTGKKSTEQATSSACIDLEIILKGLDSLSKCMDQLALQAQLMQCDLIVCVGHPDKLEFPKVQEALKQQQQPPPQHDLKLEA